MQGSVWQMSRWSRRSRARFLVIDVVGALIVTAASIGGSIGEARSNPHVAVSLRHYLDSHPPGGWYALPVLAGLVLIWRRRAPIPVLAASVLCVTVYAGAGYVEGAALVPVYVALYTVGTLEPRRTAVLAGIAAVVAPALAGGIGGPFGYLGGPNTVLVAFGGASVAVGIAVASRRQWLAAMSERAERVEREREEETRRRIDAERLRIARELHDVVAHSMSMINVQAGVAAHVLSDHPEQAVEALTAIKAASREGLRELRAILNVLRQVDTDEQGRSPAPGLSELESLADATRQAGLPTAVSVSARRQTELPPTVELAVYRIVQESLTNAIRHAGPGTSAQVRVVVGRRKVVVQVDNDGGPVRVPVAPGGGESGLEGGRGIAGMRERAEAFDGSLEAGPMHEGGWRVKAVLAVPEVGR